MTSTNSNEWPDEFEENEAENGIAIGNILREPRIRKRTEKGLRMELERAKKKRDKVIGTVDKRIRSVDILLKESEDIVKLTAGKDGLEMELDNLRSLQTEVMHILLENADEKLQSEEEEYFGVILNKALECLADVKIRIRDKEQERAELLSRKSDRSSNANSFVTRSLSTSSKRISAARAEAAALRVKLDSLTKLQNIQRKQNELTRQKEELERLEEQERLQGELSAAEVIQNLLQDTSLSCQSNEKKVIPMGEPLSEPIKQDNVDARTQFPVESRISHRSCLDVNTPEFIPWDSKWLGPKQVHVPLQQSMEIPYPSQPYTNQGQVQQIQRENAEIQGQQVQLLERLTLPVPKPPVFEGDILEYPKWESAFDALIEEGTVKPSYKLYYLGEYTGGIAKKMVGGLLGLRSEDAYSRARKVLKERFGDPFKIYEAYREKLKTWPVCTTGGELQDYSDFLVMTRETMRTVKYLKEFDTFSAIRELAARLPIFYGNKWRESAKRTEASQGEYTFDNFVDFTQESSSDANHPIFSHEALAATRRQLQRGLKKDDKQTLKPQGRFPRGTAFKTTNEGEEREDNRLQSGKALCFRCDEEHNLEDCKTFLKGTVAERVRFVKSKGLCFACLKKGHMVQQCQRKRKCQICKKPHVTVLHYDSPPLDTSGEIRAKEEKLKATSSCECLSRQ